MRRLRVVYRPYRVGLFALALGLASVSMIRGTTVNPQFVDIQLPIVQSSTVLPVFVETSRFVTKGGGSGPDRPGVTLFQGETRADSSLSFRLTNYRDEPIYLPRLKPQSRISKSAVPYFLECQDERDGPIYIVPSAFEFDRNVVRLDPEDELTLLINPPTSARNCVLLVVFAESESAALVMATQNPFSSMKESSFLDSVSNWHWVAWVSRTRR